MSKVKEASRKKSIENIEDMIFQLMQLAEKLEAGEIDFVNIEATISGGNITERKKADLKEKDIDDLTLKDIVMEYMRNRSEDE